MWWLGKHKHKMRISWTTEELLLWSIGSIYTYFSIYTGCPRRNVKYFGRVFLELNYTDITQNTYIQS